MAQSVALAGRTLLDTVDHILDYSKISNLTRDQKRDRAKVGAMRHQVTEDIASDGLVSVDLARLTEEIVESAISAYRHNPRPVESDSVDRHAVSVTLDIQKRYGWTTAMTPGTWVRLLNNILGNSLKYTPSGVISIKLSVEDSQGTSAVNPGLSQVALQIQDTGIGMSEDFLNTEMWQPFRQANSLTSGTGLGLSIVKEVAKDLDASIDVESELGTGTSVTVRFLAAFHKSTAATPQTPETNNSDFATQGSRRRFQLLGAPDRATEIRSEVTTRAVLESVARTASDWLRYEVSFLDRQTLCPASGDVCAVSEKDLLLLHDKDPQMVDDLMSRLAADGSQILVLAQSVTSSQPDFDFSHFPVRPLYIYQPIGPQKLERVVTKLQDSIVTRQSGDYFSHNPHSVSTPKPRMIRGDSGRVAGGQMQSPGAAGKFAANMLRTDVQLSHDHIRLPATPVSAMRTPLPAVSERVETFRRGSLTLDLPDRGNIGDQYGQTVLLVEDNDINMRLLLALMGKLKLESDCAVNGLEALEKYKAAPSRYFLVLMDMNMPIMDGFEATAKIRDFERSSKLRRVNIAALTGVTSSEARTRAKDAGVNVYVTKPIRMKDLTGMIGDIRAAQSAT